MFILHTANLYLDRPFFSCSKLEYGKERRIRQREVLEEIINKVLEYKADVLLFAGNLLDAEYVTEETLCFLFEKLDAIKPTPVIIVPGATDPISEHSPYLLETFPENVVVIHSTCKKKWESDRIPLVVYSIGEKYIKATDFPILDIPPNNAGKNYILVSYNLPISDNPGNLTRWFENLPSVFSYIAFGEGHRFKQLYSSSKRISCCCGIPDPINFDDVPPFGVLGIKFQFFDNCWEVTQVEHISTQRHSCAVIDFDISSIVNREELYTRLKSEFISLQKPYIVHLRFTGIISPNILKYIPEIMEVIQKESLSLTWSIDGEIEGIENPEEIPQNTVLSEFFKQMFEEQKCAPDPTVARIAKRARDITLRVQKEIELKIPAIETCEVPLEWNL